MRHVVLATVASLASLALFAAAAAASARPDEKTPKGVAALTWMAGDWTRTEEGSTFDESWMPPRGDAMCAVSRMAAKDRTQLVELSTIEETDGVLTLRIRHFSKTLEPWKSEASGAVTLTCVEQTARKVVFEDAKRDFPRRIVYERDGDVLVAALEGTHGDRPAAMTFRFTAR